MSKVSGHSFVIRKEPSPIDPLSEPGRMWYAALKLLAKQDGWLQTSWGLVDQAQQMYLINEWSSTAAMEAFLHDGGLQEFLDMLGPLQGPEAMPASMDDTLPHPSHWRSLEPLQLGWLDPAPLARAHIHHLQFDQGVTDATRQGLNIDLQLLSSYLHRRSQEICSRAMEEAQQAHHTLTDSDVEVPFNGIEGAWIHSAGAEIDTAVAGDKSDPAFPTFVLISSWRNEQSEHRLLDEPGIFRSDDGTMVSPRTFLENQILGRANRGVESRTLAFEQLNPGNLDVVAKESYSTYLARYY